MSDNDFTTSPATRRPAAIRRNGRSSWLFLSIKFPSQKCPLWVARTRRREPVRSKLELPGALARSRCGYDALQRLDLSGQRGTTKRPRGGGTGALPPAPQRQW